MDFKERLKLILAGRKITPWGKALGMSNSVIHALSNGNAPGPNYLQVLSRVENVNLNFLLNNQGSPFLVQETESCFIQDWIRSNKMCFIYMAVCQGKHIFGLESTDRIEHRGRSIDFKRFELISCPLTRNLIDTLSGFSRGYVTELTPDIYERLRKGKMGSYLCLDNEGGNGALLKKTHDLNKLGTEALSRYTAESHPQGDIDIMLMRAALEVVAYVIHERNTIVTETDRANMVSSLYKSSVQRGLSANEIEPASAFMLMDML